MMHLVHEKSELLPALSWQNILTSLDDAVVVIDSRGDVFFLNQAAEMLTGTSATKMLHQSHREVFRKNPWLLEMIAKSQPPGDSSTRAEGDFITLRGRVVPVSMAVSPLQDQTGEGWGSILLLRDLTHQREMEEQLKRSDRLALLGTLAAGLAHEIKNPLGGIKGASQLIRHEVVAEPSLLEFTDVIIREADRINQLMEQLLDLSRPRELYLEPLNIHALLNHVLFLERHAFADGKVVIRKNFDPSLPPVRGDRGQLIQVFLNLVKNSLEAMNGEGCLMVTTRMETDNHFRGPASHRGKLIRVDIEDDGPGIKPEHLPHIFSPFFTTKKTGTGLGLATCHGIIEEHGGLIRVESSEGNGAAFRVSLVMAQ
jgi:two-component system, NtrC family, nitrogen regulation sensor histidine kinase GlnL